MQLCSFMQTKKYTLREGDDVYCLLYWSGMMCEVFSKNTFFYIHTVLAFIAFSLTYRLAQEKQSLTTNVYIKP